MNYFLLPGNPPAVHFYALWAEEIRHQHPEAKVYVSHYPDLEVTEDSHEAMLNVLESHLIQLKTFHESVGSPVTLVGHSLGGYFALELLRKTPALIQGAVLIHPFLREPSLLGQITLNMAGTFNGFDRVQQAIIGSRRGLEVFFPDLTYVSDAEIRRAFRLAHHERKTIGSDRSEIEIETHLRERIHVYYCLKDIWCTPEVVESLRRQVSVRECTEPHGFVTDEKHRRSLLLRVLGAL